MSQQQFITSPRRRYEQYTSQPPYNDTMTLIQQQQQQQQPPPNNVGKDSNESKTSLSGFKNPYIYPATNNTTNIQHSITHPRHHQAPYQPQQRYRNHSKSPINSNNDSNNTHVMSSDNTLIHHDHLDSSSLPYNNHDTIYPSNMRTPQPTGYQFAPNQTASNLVLSVNNIIPPHIHSPQRYHYQQPPLSQLPPSPPFATTAVLSPPTKAMNPSPPTTPLPPPPSQHQSHPTPRTLQLAHQVEQFVHRYQYNPRPTAEPITIPQQPLPSSMDQIKVRPFNPNSPLPKQPHTPHSPSPQQQQTILAIPNINSNTSNNDDDTYYNQYLPTHLNTFRLQSPSSYPLKPHRYNYYQQDNNDDEDKANKENDDINNNNHDNFPSNLRIDTFHHQSHSHRNQSTRTTHNNNHKNNNNNNTGSSSGTKRVTFVDDSNLISTLPQSATTPNLQQQPLLFQKSPTYNGDNVILTTTSSPSLSPQSTSFRPSQRQLLSHPFPPQLETRTEAVFIPSPSIISLHTSTVPQTTSSQRHKSTQNPVLTTATIPLNQNTDKDTHVTTAMILPTIKTKMVSPSTKIPTDPQLPIYFVSNSTLKPRHVQVEDSIFEDLMTFCRQYGVNHNNNNQVVSSPLQDKNKNHKDENEDCSVTNYHNNNSHHHCPDIDSNYIPNGNKHPTQQLPPVFSSSKQHQTNTTTIQPTIPQPHSHTSSTPMSISFPNAIFCSLQHPLPHLFLSTFTPSLSHLYQHTTTNTKPQQRKQQSPPLQIQRRLFFIITHPTLPPYSLEQFRTALIHVIMNTTEKDIHALPLDVQTALFHNLKPYSFPNDLKQHANNENTAKYLFAICPCYAERPKILFKLLKDETKLPQNVLNLINKSYDDQEQYQHPKQQHTSYFQVDCTFSFSQYGFLLLKPPTTITSASQPPHSLDNISQPTSSYHHHAATSVVAPIKTLQIAIQTHECISLKNVTHRVFNFAHQLLHDPTFLAQALFTKLQKVSSSNRAMKYHIEIFIDDLVPKQPMAQ